MQARLLIAAALAAALAWPTAGRAQTRTASAGSAGPHVIVALPSEVAWGPAPASLPAGARAALLEGDPSRAGPFVLRLWMPADYRIPPHFHPKDEHVTVVQGTFHVGMGESFDAAAARRLPAGTYASLPTGMRHYAFTREETVIQLHGEGPWGLTYVNPGDDPRGR